MACTEQGRSTCTEQGRSNRKIWQLLDEFQEMQLLKGLKEGTVSMKIRDLEKMFVYFEEKHPGKRYKNISREDILSYLNDYENLFGKEVTSHTFNRRISYVKSLYDFLLEKEEVLINPAISIEYLPVTKGDHLGLFTEEEVKRILSVIPDSPIGRRDRAMLELLYGSGLRLSELIYLDVEDIDFESMEIFVRKGKFDKERIVPVGGEALSILKRYLDERHRWIKPKREKKALFLTAVGNRINQAIVQNIIKKWKEKAGVTSKGSSHAFRHSMASHMLGRGASITAIQRILGHEHITTTQEYVHIHEKDMKDMHSKSHPKAGESE